MTDSKKTGAGGAQATWFHSIELPDGSVTPGTFDTRPIAGLVPWPKKNEGRAMSRPGHLRRILGVRDGAAWRRRGHRDRHRCARLARPILAVQTAAAGRAADGARTAAQRFEFARQALGSRVQRVTASVYDLDPAVHGHFDVVFWGNMLVHLRDPSLALEKVAAVCTGDLVMVDCVDAFLDLTSPNTPSARLSPARDQWWRHNHAGLRALLELCGFEIAAVSPAFITPFGASFKANSGRLSFLRGALSRQVGRHPAAPVLARVLGLFNGTHDIAIRALPRKA